MPIAEKEMAKLWKGLFYCEYLLWGYWGWDVGGEGDRADVVVEFRCWIVLWCRLADMETKGWENRNMALGRFCSRRPWFIPRTTPTPLYTTNPRF